MQLQDQASQENFSKSFIAVCQIFNASLKYNTLAKYDDSSSRICFDFIDGHVLSKLKKSASLTSFCCDFVGDFLL